MTHIQHWAVFITNHSKRQDFIKTLMSGVKDIPEGFGGLTGKKGALFSKLELDKFIEEEAIHDLSILTPDTSQSLRSMSSGERKKALLKYLLSSEPDYLLLDNPFDNLDKNSQADLKALLQKLSKEVSIIQIISRQEDILSFINKYGILNDSNLQWYDTKEEVAEVISHYQLNLKGSIPGPLEKFEYEGKYLIQLKRVEVSYGDKIILRDIFWDIEPGTYWELSGKNGSGKTTILSMITGDNPKAYGQEIYLFGRKKGSGESIWEIKKNIGYFTPAMVDRFRGYHSLENMLISGLLDSIGLYVRPNEAQIRLARKWLELVGMEEMKDNYFHDLSLGQQRLIMCIRAMIKHPLLLILDEPTAGLDDTSAALIVELVNKMAEESHCAVIFVSHREEPGLDPQWTYQLEMSSMGSIGKAQSKRT